ncbi:hypothetical protein ACJIZ3_024577 [Penstemon smallii]|uniref:Uncharacterized protein n=1 Tax=Penstemon smallii TaxID=265156 RepID=A0ABD3TTW7_9LAMI
MSTAKSFIIGHKTSNSYIKQYYYPRSSQPLSWNQINFSGGNTKRVHFKTQRTSIGIVYANSVPGAPLPSTPPPSGGSIKSWLVGIILSVILPFFTNKFGPLWVLKNRIENAVETVEEIAEAVEKVAGEVDKIAEDIADDLPAGKLKNLIELVEDVAEKTAKTADSLDNIIDKVQDAEDQVESMVESIDKETKFFPKGKKDNQ